MPIGTFKLEAHVFYIAHKCELCSQEVQSLWVFRMRGHKIVMCNACKKRMILALTSVPYPAREYAEQTKASNRTESSEGSSDSD